ncbi:hypothetical protein FRB95_001188 [Tulasnella sp. JGI-2019a]|nr:hypothetical protein FRB95_001188 [Tulasnella sp. JGI-2019a]
MTDSTLSNQGQKVDAAMLGMYVWEVMHSGWFDLEVLQGKRKFKWPMLVYWWSKYFTLWFIISINIMFQATTPLNCVAVGHFIDFSGRTAIAAASNLLLLRTLALWHFDRRVMYPMILFSIGQWIILFHNMFITTDGWSDAQGTCVVLAVRLDWTKVQTIYSKPKPPTEDDPDLIKLCLFSAMSFDFTVLCLALWALIKLPGVSSLWKLVFFDGLAYFIVAFSCYLAVTIVAVFPGIKPVVMYMVSNPATIIAATAANRSFVRVVTYQESIMTLPTSAIDTMGLPIPRIPWAMDQRGDAGQLIAVQATNADAMRDHMKSFSSLPSGS